MGMALSSLAYSHSPLPHLAHQVCQITLATKLPTGRIRAYFNHLYSAQLAATASSLNPTKGLLLTERWLRTVTSSPIIMVSIWSATTGWSAGIMWPATVRLCWAYLIKTPHEHYESIHLLHQKLWLSSLVSYVKIYMSIELRFGVCQAGGQFMVVSLSTYVLPWWQK